MRVQFLSHASDFRYAIWEVSKGRKRWTVVWRLSDCSWCITAGNFGRDVSPSGRLGRKLIAAVEAKR